MFKPNYTITHEILNNLMRTAEAKALIDNAYPYPEMGSGFREMRPVRPRLRLAIELANELRDLDETTRVGLKQYSLERLH